MDILDENDNDPDFDPDSYLIRISELSIINSTVVQLLAFDMDETDTPNSQLTFTLAGDTFGKSTKLSLLLPALTIQAPSNSIQG